MLMNCAMSRRGLDLPLPSRTRSPVPGLTREQKMEGMVSKHLPAPSEELYLMTKPKESAAASIVTWIRPKRP